MKKDATIITTLCLVSITMLSGIVLASSKAMADDSAVSTAFLTAATFLSTFYISGVHKIVF